MKILLPIAGPDTAFKERGYAWCKSLIELNGKALIQHVYENVSQVAHDRMIFVIRKEEDDRYHLGDVLRLLSPQADVIRAESPTAGAACTALLAVQQVNGDDELLITNGDQLIDVDLAAAIDGFRRRGADAGTLVFDSVHPRWSYVRVGDDDWVTEAAEKRPISRWATAGFYYFRRGADFVSAAMDSIRKDANVHGGFYVCPTFNEMILRQQRVAVHRIPREAYRSLASPQDIDAYLSHGTAALVPSHV